MSRREFLNKTVMPVGTVLFLAFLFRPLCMVQGELDWRLLMLLVGIPFGIREKATCYSMAAFSFSLFCFTVSQGKRFCS